MRTAFIIAASVVVIALSLTIWGGRHPVPRYVVPALMALSVAAAAERWTPER